MSSTNLTRNELHSPSELLSVAQHLFESDDPRLLRPVVLEAMTCLEVYVRDTVFKALANKLDPLLVKWLEDKTERDLESRLSVLTPVATGYRINKQDKLWADYGKARPIRNKVVHAGKRVTKEEAGFVLQMVHDWLAYLVSSVELEFALLNLKKQVETKTLSIRNREQAVDLVIDYFGQTRAAKKDALPKSRQFGAVTVPVHVFEFGRYRVALTVQLVPRGALNAVLSHIEQQGIHLGERYLPPAFTHGAAIYFARGEHGGSVPPNVRWIDERLATIFIGC